MKRGYIGQSDNKENIYKTLLLHGTDSFHTELEDLFNTLKPNDQIIIYDTTDLNISMRKLVNLASKSIGKEISIEIIDSFRIDLDTYLAIIESTIEMEQEWLGLRTKLGIEKAKEKGKFSGRPKLSEEKIEEIRYWYNQRLNLRSISEKTNVSLGTVHKYVNYFKEGRE